MLLLLSSHDFNFSDFFGVVCSVAREPAAHCRVVKPSSPQLQSHSFISSKKMATVAAAAAAFSCISFLLQHL